MKHAFYLFAFYTHAAFKRRLSLHKGVGSNLHIPKKEDLIFRSERFSRREFKHILVRRIKFYFVSALRTGHCITV